MWQATRPLILQEGRLFGQEPAALARLQGILLEARAAGLPRATCAAMFPDRFLPPGGRSELRPAALRRPIPADELVLPVFRAWRRDWFLLAAGDFAAGQYNCMTVGWGGFVRLWDRPVALVAVKPSRHTFGFLQRFPGFHPHPFLPRVPQGAAPTWARAPAATGTSWPTAA